MRWLLTLLAIGKTVPRDRSVWASIVRDDAPARVECNIAACREHLLDLLPAATHTSLHSRQGDPEHLSRVLVIHLLELGEDQSLAVGCGKRGHEGRQVGRELALGVGRVVWNGDLYTIRGNFSPDDGMMPSPRPEMVFSPQPPTACSRDGDSAGSTEARFRRTYSRRPSTAPSARARRWSWPWTSLWPLSASCRGGGCSPRSRRPRSWRGSRRARRRPASVGLRRCQ